MEEADFPYFFKLPNLVRIKLPTPNSQIWAGEAGQISQMIPTLGRVVLLGCVGRI